MRSGCRGAAIRTTGAIYPGGWIVMRTTRITQAGRTRDQQKIFCTCSVAQGFGREHAALRSGQLWHLASDESSYVFVRDIRGGTGCCPRSKRRSAKGTSHPVADTPAKSGCHRASARRGQSRIGEGEIRMPCLRNRSRIFSLN